MRGLARFKARHPSSAFNYLFIFLADYYLATVFSYSSYFDGR